MSRTLVDCGCVARVHSDGSGVEIDYCPEHEAAPKMLEALRRLEDVAGQVAAAVTIATGHQHVVAGVALLGALADACTNARAAIAAATGGEP